MQKVEGSGRKKGTQNKVTRNLKKFIELLINENADVLRNDIAQLEAKERVLFFERLFAYIIPKQQAQKVEMQAQAEIKKEEKRMTETEIKEEFERLKELFR